MTVTLSVGTQIYAARQLDSGMEPYLRVQVENSSLGSICATFRYLRSVLCSRQNTVISPSSYDTILHNNLIVCTDEGCGTPDGPEHGRVQFHGVAVGSISIYSCDQGDQSCFFCNRKPRIILKSVESN